MSWDMWHVCGIGFDVHPVQNERLRDFILNHKETYQKVDPNGADEVIRYIADNYKHLTESSCLYEELLEEFGYISLAFIVAEIMRGETGICFVAPGISDDTTDHVLFTAAMPWNYNDVEARLSRDYLIETMQKYADELGLIVDEDVDLRFSD